MGQITSLDRPGKGTEIGRVRGLGSAHQGAHHWQAMHLTSAGSLITGAYVAFTFLLVPDFTYATMRAWLSGFIPSLAMALLVVSFFRHTQLGLQVLIEDYVDRPGPKYACMLVLNLLTFALAAFGIYCLARIGFGALADAAGEQAKAQMQQAVQGMLQNLQGAPR